MNPCASADKDAPPEGQRGRDSREEGQVDGGSNLEGEVEGASESFNEEDPAVEKVPEDGTDPTIEPTDPPSPADMPSGLEVGCPVLLYGCMYPYVCVCVCVCVCVVVQYLLNGCLLPHAGSRSCSRGSCQGNRTISLHGRHPRPSCVQQDHDLCARDNPRPPYY